MRAAKRGRPIQSWEEDVSEASASSFSHSGEEPDYSDDDDSEWAAHGGPRGERAREPADAAWPSPGALGLPRALPARSLAPGLLHGSNYRRRAPPPSPYLVQAAVGDAPSGGRAPWRPAS